MDALDSEQQCVDEDAALLQELANELDMNQGNSIDIKANDSAVSNGITEDTILRLLPIHQKLQTELISLQRKCKQQAEDMSRLQAENINILKELSEKEMQPNSDIYEVQMEALEKTITQLQRELESSKEKLLNHDEIAKRTIAQLKHELGSKLEQITKKFEAANKDKETMVIKYAQSQKEVLNLKKVQEEFEKKLRECAKERELTMTRLKNFSAERNRLCQLLEAKSTEFNSVNQENEKLKEQLTSKDIKIKWAQNKLKTEVDVHKETQQKLEKLQHKLQRTREEAEQVRHDCQEMIRTYQESEEVKSNSLDIKLKEKSHELEYHLQEKNDQEEMNHNLQRDLKSLQMKHKLIVEENSNLGLKVSSLEKDRLEYERNLTELRETLNAQRQEMVDLVSKLAEMDNLSSMLNRECEKSQSLQSELERSKQCVLELESDMEACRAKENELLEYTERLTSKSVQLQSELASLEAKYQSLSSEQAVLFREKEEISSSLSSLEVQLEDEKQLRKQETQLLARKLAEKKLTLDNLTLKLDDEINENRVMKRRHLSSVKELTREIQHLKRRLEASESSNSLTVPDRLSASSRASSSNSLDALPYNNTSHTTANSTVSGVNNPALHPVSRHYQANTNGSVADSQPNVVTREPTKQLLIERIVKLQKALARKNEKIEFLEEHAKQLLTELRKKSKVIQSYVMNMESGTLSTEKMDQNKAEFSRRGGIMASVYSSHANDGALTFELLLEINQKLQAVLEDTLLKNITLKENINTLGEEIAKLSSSPNSQHRQQRKDHILPKEV